MTDDRPPFSPTDAYKAIIDQLVRETSHSVHETLIVEHGLWLNAPDADGPNAFVRSLSAEQRRMLARLVHDERTGAIHDALALLTWWISTQHVALTFHGQTMPAELSGEGLNGDYIGRLNGWEWPVAGDSTGT